MQKSFRLFFCYIFIPWRFNYQHIDNIISKDQWIDTMVYKEICTCTIKQNMLFNFINTQFYIQYMIMLQHFKTLKPSTTHATMVSIINIYQIQILHFKRKHQILKCYLTIFMNNNHKKIHKKSIP